MNSLRQTWSMTKREFRDYFATPIAFVFIAIFLLSTGFFTFYFGRLFERGEADLLSFFAFHPWLYLLLAPALSMRLWAEERRNGTIELLLTLPMNTGVAVFGKFLAAWLFAGLALILTFPLWITVSYLGDPDHGIIFAAYLGSWLLAGAMLAIGSCISAATSNQVIAFIVSVVVCFLFIVAGLPLVSGWLGAWMPEALVDLVFSLSLLDRFDAISKGVLVLGDLLYFAIMISAWLLATHSIVERSRIR